MEYMFGTWDRRRGVGDHLGVSKQGEATSRRSGVGDQLAGKMAMLRNHPRTKLLQIFDILLLLLALIITGRLTSAAVLRGIH